MFALRTVRKKQILTTRIMKWRSKMKPHVKMSPEPTAHLSNTHEKNLVELTKTFYRRYLLKHLSFIGENKYVRRELILDKKTTDTLTENTIITKPLEILNFN